MEAKAQGVVAKPSLEDVGEPARLEDLNTKPTQSIAQTLVVQRTTAMSVV
jgi:hypothetical protein